MIFCAIPASFYVVARIYFGVAFLILDKTVPSKFKKYGIISMLFLLSNYIVSAIVILLPVLHPLMLHFTEWIASIALLSAALIGLYYQPTVKSQLHAIYETSVGGIADVLYEVCKPEIIKVSEVGYFSPLLCSQICLATNTLIISIGCIYKNRYIYSTSTSSCDSGSSSSSSSSSK